MAPGYEPTDMVLVVSPSVISPEVGSVIVFETEFRGQPVPPHIHRIVVKNENGDWITKGDAAASIDPWSVAPDQVTGVAIASFPGAWVRGPFLIGLLLFVMFSALLWRFLQTPP